MIEFIFHIGMPKAASTYIQSLCYNNKNLLLKNSILYETHGKNISHGPFLSNIGKSNFISQFTSFINDQIKLANSYRCKKILISYEILFFLKNEDLTKMKNYIDEYGKIKTIIFLRRQDQFLEAHWKQSFKELSNYFSSFEDYKRNYKIPNYLSVIENWNSISDHGIKVIPLNKKNKDTLETIFFNEIGINDFTKIEKPKNAFEKNMGLTNKGVDFCFLGKDVFIKEPHNRIKNLVYKYLPILVKKEIYDNGMLSIKERKLIMKKCRVINNIISKKYYESKQLFDEVIEDGKYEKITLDDIPLIIFTMLNEIDKHISLLNKKLLFNYTIFDGFNNLAIFGLGKAGKMTYEFIKKYYPEKTKYFIDDNVKGEYEGIPIVTTNEFLEKYQDEVDLVVFGKYQHLNPKLLPNLKIPYLRLENIV